MKGGITSIADVEAIEQIPLAQRDLPTSTLEAIERGAELGAKRTALQFFLMGEHYERCHTTSYGELVAAVRRMANALHDLGVGPNDVTSLLLPNLPETFISIFGAEAAGIANPVNPMLEPDVIVEILNAAETKVLVTLAPFPRSDLWEKIDRIRHRVPTLQAILCVDMIRYLSLPARVLVRLSRLRKRTDLSGPQPVLDLHDALKEQPGDRLVSGRRIDPDEVASYFHTGGTTGVPKLARHTHGNEVTNAFSGCQHTGIDREGVLFCGLPLFHVNGVIITGLAPFSTGASVVLGTPQGYRGPGVIDNFWFIVEHYRVKYFSGVPTVYSRLLDAPRGIARTDSLEFAICGAAPMPRALFREFEKEIGVPIVEGYGLTEGTCVSSANPPRGDRRVGSVGLRLAYEEMKTVVLDEEHEYVRDCETDEIGVVVLRGANVFAGYVQEEQNRKLWVDTQDGGPPWLNTGDLGRQDSDGYFWLTGRGKELIIRGGHNIDPGLIEEPLTRHPAVALAAAVGRPDATVGEVPVAWVQLNSGAEATEAELLEHAAAAIGERAAVPKAIRFADALPLTTVGKIYKPRLRQAEVRHVIAAELAAIAGIDSSEIEVVADARHGERAEISAHCAPGAAAAEVQVEIDRRLGRYSFAWDVTLS